MLHNLLIDGYRISSAGRLFLREMSPICMIKHISQVLNILFWIRYTKASKQGTEHPMIILNHWNLDRQEDRAEEAE